MESMLLEKALELPAAQRVEFAEIVWRATICRGDNARLNCVNG
jgi:hypothetical protein